MSLNVGKVAILQIGIGFHFPKSSLTCAFVYLKTASINKLQLFRHLRVLEASRVGFWCGRESPEADMELGLLNETPPSHCSGQVGTQQHKMPTPREAGPAFRLVSCAEALASWLEAVVNRPQPSSPAPASLVSWRLVLAGCSQTAQPIPAPVSQRAVAA